MGTGYYWRNELSNMKYTKEFFMTLEGFDITEEYYDKYELELFLILNRSFTTNDPKALEFK